MKGVREPGITALAVLLLGFSVGSATLLFSVFDALLLRPLPVPHPEQLVRLTLTRPQVGQRSDFPEPVLQAFLTHARSFASIGALRELSSALRDGERVDRVRPALASPGFFDTFGIAENLRPTDGTVVLSHAFAARHPLPIGKKILLAGQPFTVAAILPEGFNGAQVETGADLYLNLSAFTTLFPAPKQREDNRFFEITARLAPGVSLQAANQEALQIYQAASPPETNPYMVNGDFSLVPIERGASRLREQSGPALGFAMAAVGLLLLMAVANISSILLARFAARNEEFAIRRALGAPTLSLIRIALAEAMLITLSAGLVATGIILLGIPLLQRALPPIRTLDTSLVPTTLLLQTDWRLVSFAMGICALAAILIAVSPALRATSTHLHQSLRSTRGSSAIRGRSALIAFEVAIATLLAIAAALTFQTLLRLRTLHPGFSASQVLTLTIDPTLQFPPNPGLGGAIQQWQAAIESLPGVDSVAFTGLRILRGSGVKTTYALPGQVIPPSGRMNTSMHGVSLNYFRTMGIEKIEGRLFTEADYHPGTSRRIIVNQAFARFFFPNTSAVGKLVRSGASDSPPDQIIGIVSDAKYRTLREPIPPTVYSAWTPSEHARLALLVRSKMNPSTLIEPIRQTIERLSPGMPIQDPATLAADIEASLSTEILLANLSIAFALLSLFIAGAGLYALLAYLVILRRREIGIRLAIGAPRPSVAALLLEQATKPVLCGIAAACLIAIAMGPWLNTVLFEVSARDPELLAGTGALVLLVALAAAALPSIAATRVNPASALRNE
ncbi:ABC transporter permease [Bryobacter aggregatus]|uniref:ABC transporter permease n=1 Tax=Bryobacter aggregatus TaxID=360054 RepID=UPI0004E114F5|nr:ABC transporter permease [Bryobacter aggregatus]